MSPELEQALIRSHTTACLRHSFGRPERCDCHVQLLRAYIEETYDADP